MKIGADPELFLSVDGEYQSAHGIIPGTKEEPHKVKQGAVQVDGMALEFNIDPANTADDFVSNIEVVMDEMRKMVPANMHFAIEPVANFTDAVLAAQPKEAIELGCDPDYNAYTGRQNIVPDADNGMRTAAGHVHVGFKEEDVDDPFSPEHMDACIKLVKQLDYFLALPAIQLENNERRQLYGKAGSFRPKPYGVEYRVLSNFWLRTQGLQNLVYNSTMRAVEELKAGNCLADYLPSPEEAINDSDAYIAVDILRLARNADLFLWDREYAILRPEQPNDIDEPAGAEVPVRRFDFDRVRPQADLQRMDELRAQLGGGRGND